MEDISLLKLFSEKKETFDKYFTKKNFSAGEVVFKENSSGDAIFLIDSGVIVIEKALNETQTDFKELAILTAGDFFGEISVIEERPRSAQARAVAEVSLFEINREDFFKFTREFPEEGLQVFSGIMKVTMDRLQHTSKELTLLFSITKLLTRTYADEKDFLRDIVNEVALYFEGYWNIESYFYNFFNDEFEKAGSNCEFDCEGKNKIPENNGWLDENVYAMTVIENAALAAYIIFNSREKLNQNQKNNWGTIFNTISYILGSGLRNIKQNKELALIAKLKDRKNTI